MFNAIGLLIAMRQGIDPGTVQRPVPDIAVTQAVEPVDTGY